MQEHDGSGALTITVPINFNKSGQLEIDPVVSIKMPRATLGTGIYYATEDVQLTQRDPTQTDCVEDDLRRRRKPNG